MSVQQGGQDYQTWYKQGFGEGYKQGKAEPKKKNLWWGFKALAWLLTLFLSFITGIIKSPQFRDNVCDVLPGRFEKIVSLSCAKAHQQVTQAEAELVLDRYLADASGATPSDAWPLMSSRMQKEVGPEQTFERQYANVLWMERWDPILRSKVSGESANRFTVQWLTFTGKTPETPDAKVNKYTRTFQLAHTNTTTLIIDQGKLYRSETDTWVYPRVYTASRAEVRGPMRGYAGPSTRLVDGGDPTLAHDGLLRPFCKVVMSDGAWIYTTEGWIPQAFLDGGTRDLSEMAVCDAHYQAGAQTVVPSS